MAEESQDGGGGGDDGRQSPPPVSTRKGKSCKGCLFYTSQLKSDGRNPICVGISRTLPQVPSYIFGETEMEAAKEGRSPSDFKYTCVGYSVFLDNKDNPADTRDNQTELPLCAGLELLVDRRSSRTSTAGHAPVSVHQEDGTVRSQTRAHRPAHSAGDEFISRFRRNAGLVASGVARNLNKMGNQVKEMVDDILYPYRRRPK